MPVNGNTYYKVIDQYGTNDAEEYCAQFRYINGNPNQLAFIVHCQFFFFLCFAFVFSLLLASFVDFYLLDIDTICCVAYVDLECEPESKQQLSAATGGGFCN
jgi:hypothetical protein